MKYNHSDTAVPLFLIATAVDEGIRTHSHAYRIWYKCQVKEQNIPATGMTQRGFDRAQWTLSANDIPGSAEIQKRPDREGNTGEMS